MTRKSPGVVTWIMLGIVALAAAILSFAALSHLAILCGTPAALAWLLPVCVDTAALVASRIWLASGSPEAVAHQARTLALAALVLSVVGNAADHALVASDTKPPVWAVVAVGAVPPAVLGGAAHLVGLLNKRPEDLQVTNVGARELVESGDAGESLVESTTNTNHTLVERARELVAAGEAGGRVVGRGTIARELGVSDNQARQLLGEIRQVKTA